MANFTDKNGRVWTVELTVGDIRRIERLVGVNLARIDQPRKPTNGTVPDAISSGVSGGPLLTELFVDVMLMADVLYALVKPQADAAGVTDEAFGQALGGAAMESAKAAFWSAVEDFFRHGRPDLVAAIRKQAELAGVVIQVAAERVAAIHPALGNSASNSPDLSGSSPSLTPSGN